MCVCSPPGAPSAGSDCGRGGGGEARPGRPAHVDEGRPSFVPRHLFYTGILHTTKNRGGVIAECPRLSRPERASRRIPAIERRPPPAGRGATILMPLKLATFLMPLKLATMHPYATKDRAPAALCGTTILMPLKLATILMPLKLAGRPLRDEGGAPAV